MLTKDGKIKCDACGKFAKHENHVVKFTPDSAYIVEKIEDYDTECSNK